LLGVTPLFGVTFLPGVTLSIWCAHWDPGGVSIRDADQ
jgi:hypothetical protein